MRDARPRRHAMATRGGDKQEPDAPLPSFPHGVRRRAALLVLEAASQVTVDRGCHSERSLRSEESTRSDLPGASAQAGGFATPLKDKSLRVDPSASLRVTGRRELRGREKGEVTTTGKRNAGTTPRHASRPPRSGRARE